MYGATVGKAAILAETAVTNQAVCGCTPCLGVLNTYLFFYLVSQRQKFRNASEGGAQPNFSKDKIVTFPFPLPPLAEQKRIVARVDELMGLCDELEGQQQERELRKSVLIRSSLSRFAESPTRENLGYLFHKSYDIPPSELRKSILTLAVQGLLVPHDSESVEWETRKLKDLATKIGSGSTPSGGKESYKESGVPLIRSMNIYFGGFVRQGLAFLNDEQAEKLKNVAVKADDVLLNITGASIGRVATAPRDMEGARVNQHVCIIRPTSEITPKFLELVLASPVVQNLIDAIQVGATREALTKAMIEQFEIPVPSLAEQHRIVAKVDQLMALVDELERQQAASREKASNLLDAIVHEMTSGG
jgi:type I restriction enzyme S subunit